MKAKLRKWAQAVEPYVYFLLLLTAAVLPLSQAAVCLSLTAAFFAALLAAGHKKERPSPVLRKWEQGALYAILAVALFSITLSRDPKGSALHFFFTVGQYAAFVFVLLRYGWRRPSLFGLDRRERGASPDDEAAMSELVPLLCSVPAFYRNKFFSLPRPLQLLLVFLAVSCLVSLLGLGQRSTGLDTAAVWVDPAAFPGLTQRVFSTWENPNILAGYLVAVIAYSAAFFHLYKDRLPRLAAGCCGLLASACLLFTYSRGNWLALLAVLIIFCGCFDRRAVLPCGVLLVLALFVGGDEVWQRLLSLVGSEDTSIALRKAYLRSTLWIIEDHPFGVGWCGFRYVYPEYNYYLADTGVIMYHCHNIFLNVLAELGWHGLAVFLAVWGNFVYNAYRLVRYGSALWIKAAGEGYLLAAAGLAVGGLTDHVCFNPRMGLLFWLLGFSVLLARKIDEGRRP